MRANRLNAAVLAALPALTISGSLYYCSNVSAATLYYSPTTTNGNWGATTWATTSGGTYNLPWTDGSDAVFSDTAQQNLTIDANYAPNSIQNASATSGELITMNGPGTTTLTTSAFVNQSTTYPTDFSIYNVTLGGTAITVSGHAPVLTFYNASPSVSAFNGTLTLDSTSGVGSFYISNGTVSTQSGSNTNIVVEGTGEYILVNHSVTMGTLSAPNSSGVAQIQDSGSSPTLTINESTNTSAYALFNSTYAMTVNLTGGGTLQSLDQNAFASTETSFTISNTGSLQIANTNLYNKAGNYTPITISNGGKLSNSATGQYMIGNSQTFNATSGLFTGNNTNGFNITTGGSTAYIDPTGVLGLTELNATAGGAEGYSSITDLLSVFSLTTADGSSGNFVIDCSELTGFTPGTEYPVLQWASGNFTGDLGDFSALAPTGYAASLVINNNDLDVSFSIVPEPATAGLLLGAMPLMLRRRRRTHSRAELVAN